MNLKSHKDWHIWLQKHKSVYMLKKVKKKNDCMGKGLSMGRRSEVFSKGLWGSGWSEGGGVVIAGFISWKNKPTYPLWLQVRLVEWCGKRVLESGRGCCHQPDRGWWCPGVGCRWHSPWQEWTPRAGLGTPWIKGWRVALAIRWNRKDKKGQTGWSSGRCALLSGLELARPLSRPSSWVWDPCSCIRPQSYKAPYKVIRV